LGKIRVVLVDDHRLMVEAVRMALEADGDFEVVGTTTDAVHAPNVVAEASPDVVVLDVLMPGLDGLTCLTRIKGRSPEVKVVMLSASDDDSIAEQALRGGADAFVLKQIDPRDLAGVLRQAVSGQVTRTTIGRAAATEAPAVDAGLSRRELDVLRALSNGLSNQQIAAKLFLAEQTVKFHLSSVYRKLGARNRTEAVRIAVRQGIVENPIFASGESSS
jgi:DNA-binding NarL/FixJ family response regulator